MNRVGLILTVIFVILTGMIARVLAFARVPIQGAL